MASPHVRRPRLLAAFLAVAVVAALAGCGDDEESTTTSGPAATSSTRPSAGSDTSTTDASSSGTTVVRVYFARDEAVATSGRTVRTPDVAGAAMEALLEGPDDRDVELGMSTAIPDGTRLLDLAVADGVATVDLSSAFESGGGSLSMQLRVAQVVFTLTQFDSVDTVEFRLDGRPVEAVGGEGVMVDGIDRTAVAGVTPPILVESPVPDQPVSSPLTITGMSNTFEGTVQYAVTDGEGLIVAEGFTTATAGNGTFGTFEATVEFDPESPGVGAVVAFELSARDGSRVNTYEVPVTVG